MDRQFCLDMAAAHARSTTAQNKAHAAAYRAVADRLFPVAPPPVVVPPAPPSSRPFSSSSPWNTPLPAGTQWFDHPCLHVSEPVNGDTRRHYYMNELSMKVYKATAADPLGTFVMPRIVDPVFNRNREAQTFQFRLPASATPGTDDDRIFYIEDENGEYVEIALAIRSGNTITTSPGNASWARGNVRTGSGMGGLVASGGNHAGVRASNFSWRGGLITGEDVAANRIDHALVLSAGYNVLSNTLWRAPATAPDNGEHGGPLAMGTRLGIPAGVPRPAGLQPLGVALFDALQTYGAFIGDFAGGQSFLSFYEDANTVAEGDLRILNLFVWWGAEPSAMDLIGPLVRVADYQPGG